MSQKIDFVIIGGGIVGISTAYYLVESYPDKKIIILEKESEICQHQSGRNSGVIHSGIYYKPNSLKAINCIKGYKLLLKFCDKYNIPYSLCGKLIVANNDSEIIELDKLYNRGIENGLIGIRKLNSAEAREIEPNVICKEALHIPQTGITDYTLIAKKLLQLALEKNVEIYYNYKVENFEIENDSVKIFGNLNYLYTKKVINCAGLYSDELGLKSGDVIKHKIMPFKGEFYKLRQEKCPLVNGLIYPVPNPEFPFLGVHLTRMIDGNIKVGPNAILAFKKEGYKKFEFNFMDFIQYISYPGLIKLILKYKRVGIQEIKRSISKRLFHKSIEQIFKGIYIEDLISFKPGIRAQALYQNGNLEDDFLISDTKYFLHVYNSPSPAATACLAIGKHIVSKLKE